MKTVEELNEMLSAARIAMRGAIRRMTVALTNKVLWQLGGVRNPDGSIEVEKAEVFSGIGFFARPPATGKPEAIVLMVGLDNETPVVVATRDQKTLAAIAGALKANETGVFNSLAILHVTEQGKIEARLANGVALPIPTLAEVQAMVNKYNGHTHNGAVGAPVVAERMADPVGTTVLKGQ